MAADRGIMEVQYKAIDDHGSLLNKVYEMANIRQREFDMMDMMQQQHQGRVSSEDKMFMHTTVATPATVTNGRLVPGGSYPINGQQLIMQISDLSSMMSDMGVQDATMEDAENPSDGHASYMQQRCQMEAQQRAMDPHCQADKRKDPVYSSQQNSTIYMSSMASHCQQPVVPNNNMDQQHCHALYQQQQQQHLQQQQQQEEQQQQQQQQMLLQQQQHQQMLLQQQQMANGLSTGGCGMPMDGEFSTGGSRLIKRPDMIAMQKCIQWT